MTKETGGPAFPYHGPDAPKAGMTLRDHFAGLAMQAHLTHDGTDAVNEIGVARWAYEMADAMLEVRK